MNGRTHAPTRRDVAEMAGVSETIVSYVINNNRYVSKEKRERVLEAIRRLGYHPNSIARALKGKGSNHILFIADRIENEYFGRLVQEIDATAYDMGYLVSLLRVRNNHDFISRILSRQIDAAIVSSSSLEDRFIQELIDAGLPVVLLMTRDYATISGRVSRIYTGIESGVMSATRALYESGCRHPVYVDRVSVNRHFSNRSDMRCRGFCNEMETLGLPVDAHSFITNCEDHAQLYDAVRRRIASGAFVDGFVCRNDHIACTVLSAVRDEGKAIPDEVAIVGFDNSSLSSVVRPSLSTLELDKPAIAKAAIEMIDGMIAGKPASERHFTSQLILRETTRRPFGD